MNLPNKLTMGRILAIPVFIVVYLLGYNIAATIIFIVAAATDALDGHIARSRGLVTNFGKLMDPLADKLLTMSAFLCLVGVGIVPSWMVIVILGREFAVTGLRQIAAADGIVMAAGMTGKIKTVLQMVAIPLLLLDNWPGRYVGIPLDQIVLWACVAMTIISGVEYFVKNWKIVVSQGM
ncbi:MAG: CDP-diacylglycerol--glycerol-3-phosphate 3-phosphatidyltransferase [Eubacteriaceae bacterium]|nr:CDP-diacylglycerol--glycerol-3-phosphate 3-phosphatidyltransferase [Eubacteriaceae bacterium]